METSTANKGLFLTFEGSEGCGKSTQIRLLEKTLRSRGREPLLVREPGGTPSGEVIRHLLQHSPDGAALTPEAGLLLFAASRAQLVREVIRPALASGRTVISDRFLDSTTVYQGVARMIPPEVTARINAFAVGVCLPDMTFLLDLDRSSAVARMGARNRDPDRIERESESFFEAVRRGYLELAARETHRIRVLDGSQPPGEIAAQILSHLTKAGLLLEARCGAV
ncbi:MAG: dTMP kinase [Verrucomicrobiota bacterium]